MPRKRTTIFKTSPAEEVIELPEQVIDLSEPVTDQVAPAPKQRWGMPGRCPECSGVGYLDGISMATRTMFQHCTECGHKWETTQAQLAEQAG